MKITICTEARFVRTPDGAVWSEDGLRYDFWRRYLGVFSSVEVVARVLEKPVLSTSAQRVDGPNVVFHDLPYYVGPFDFLRAALAVNRRLRSILLHAEAVILRAPGNISGLALRHLRANHRPFGVEVVGDPFDVFAAGSIAHPLRRFFRWLETNRLKKMCVEATGAAYVTANTLQLRYPNPRFTTNYSSINLSDEYFATEPKDYREKNRAFELVFIGSLAQMYKAPDVLLRAVAICHQVGPRLNLTLIGEGKHRVELQRLASELGIESTVVFAGQLASTTVRTKLLQSDLFVLPSRTEGLPRAMIEAMACALPCIGTSVGGIPELLPQQDLVECGNAIELACKIMEVLSDRTRMAEMSARNLSRALFFKKSILDERRHEFYTYLRGRTESGIVAWGQMA